jgi:hypothetical protein
VGRRFWVSATVVTVLVIASGRPWSDRTVSIAAFTCIDSLLVSVVAIAIGAGVYGSSRRIGTKCGIWLRPISAAIAAIAAAIGGIVYGGLACCLYHWLVYKLVVPGHFYLGYCLQIILSTVGYCCVIGAVFGAGLGQPGSGTDKTDS